VATTREPERPVEPLAADALYRPCDIERLEFDDTDEVEGLDEMFGQDRAAESVRFGVGIRRPGFNIYALGPDETDKRSVVQRFLEGRARDAPAPPDLCYVNNFDDPHQPLALRLPAGTGGELADDVDRFLGGLLEALRGAFESEEYQGRRQSVQEEAGAQQQEAMERLQEKAREQGLRLLRTPAGFVFAPVKEGDVLSPEQIEGLTDDQRKRLEAASEELQRELMTILRQIPQGRREAQERVHDLDRQVAGQVVEELLNRPREKYEGHPKVRAYLEAMQRHIVQNARDLLEEGGDQGPERTLAALTGGGSEGEARLRRYRVNVLVEHAESDRAPVVYEDHPTYPNLLGRVEYLPVMGALITDFNLIKPGALHRANGGYLVLDARRVLMQPFAWEGLKRALSSGKVRLETPREAMGLVSTVTLDPEPLDIELKVVLVGDRLLYYLLSVYDPDFADLFKVEADFEDHVARADGNEMLYARFIARMVKDLELRPFDRSAVGRAIERASRKAGDAEKLSVHTRYIADLLRAADYWAGEDGAEVVTADHVQQAIDHWIYRSSRMRERVQEAILRDTIYIDTDGSKTGQVNGLSVVQLGEYAFGQPSRITARVRLGKGEVVDIEREVELAGPIHSKGVMILSGFLGGRYAGDRPLCGTTWWTRRRRVGSGSGRSGRWTRRWRSSPGCRWASVTRRVGMRRRA
jgi:predicted ATP-dependent protease